MIPVKRKEVISQEIVTKGKVCKCCNSCE